MLGFLLNFEEETVAIQQIEFGHPEVFEDEHGPHRIRVSVARSFIPKEEWIFHVWIARADASGNLGDFARVGVGQQCATRDDGVLEGVTIGRAALNGTSAAD
ncbi:hypothetical protein ACTJLD_00975 [Burkholderia sp. 22088]|uniref:hypothetical protein n=1 Tax=Burkholderia sp. 22088 TaxID=3453871 RepID=UPI003F87BC72